MAGREDPVELCISQTFRRSPRGGGSGHSFSIYYIQKEASERPTRGGRPRLPRASLFAGAGQLLVRCLAGAARLRDYSVGAQRSAQLGQKPGVERKGKSRLEPGAEQASGARKRGLTILAWRQAAGEVSEKLPRG